MKQLMFPLICGILTLGSCKQEGINVEKEMKKAMTQYEAMLKAHPDTLKFPQSLKTDGSYLDQSSDWWCSGFFGGTLWLLYEYNKDQKWKDAANLWTWAVQREQYNTTTHDLGFMIYYPFGSGLRLTGDTSYVPVLLQGARSLASRFDSARGVIKSWDSFKSYNYPVIIDNMMNLDFLFWASRKMNDKTLYDICIKHADATLKNHFRPDFSSYHVVCYGPSGEVLFKGTHQGYSDSSAWARGQAWALYGYVTMYRETKDQKYLNQAIGIADFYLNHPNLPEDKIPYWDFNAPGIPNEERDVSAGAITCSALFELQEYVSPEKRTVYLGQAKKMLQSLCSAPYRTETGESGNFLLKHSVGYKPGGIEVDVPLIYADYYYLEALLRYDALNKKKKN